MECHPAHQKQQFFKPESAQLSLALVCPCEENAEFISTEKLNSLLQQCDLHFPPGLAENLTRQLNFAVRKQLIQPVKTIRGSSSEIILYWDTWGVTRSDEKEIKGWENDIRHYVPLQNNNRNVESLLRLAFDTFSIVAVYRVWIRNFLHAWHEDNLNAMENKILLNRDLIIQLAITLADFYGTDQARTMIVSALFRDMNNTDQIVRLAKEFSYYDTSSLKLLQAALKMQFTCSWNDHTMVILYGQLWQQISPDDSEYKQISNEKSLMLKLGISNNERSRLRRLSIEEMYHLCMIFPSKHDIARTYLNEIHMALQQREQLQRIKQPAPSSISSKIAQTLLLTAHLRQLELAQNTSISNVCLRPMLTKLRYYPEIENENVKISNDKTLSNIRSTPISSVIKLLELYRDMQFIPQITQLESVEDAYMVDSWEQVTDWFLATNPVLDKQRTRLGWKHLEKLAAHWHAISDEYTWVLDYPDWSCIVASRNEEWNRCLPPDMKYRLVPLTTPTQLIEESNAMHHCVASYVEDCVTGKVRIFSVQNSASRLRIATAELRKNGNRWRVVQLKGKFNEEMMPRIHVDNDQISAILKTLVDFYSGNSSVFRSIVDPEFKTVV